MRMRSAVLARSQKRKSAREISIRAHLCDDLNQRQGGQVCQRGFRFPSKGIREISGCAGGRDRAKFASARFDYLQVENTRQQLCGPSPFNLASYFAAGPVFGCLSGSEFAVQSSFSFGV